MWNKHTVFKEFHHVWRVMVKDQHHAIEHHLGQAEVRETIKHINQDLKRSWILILNCKIQSRFIIKIRIQYLEWKCLLRLRQHLISLLLLKKSPNSLNDFRPPRKEMHYTHSLEGGITIIQLNCILNLFEIKIQPR